MTDEVPPQSGAPIPPAVPPAHPPGGYPLAGYPTPGGQAAQDGTPAAGWYPAQGQYAQAPTPAPRPSPKRGGWIVALVLLIVAGVLVGCVVIFALVVSSGSGTGTWGGGFGDAVAVIRIDGVISGTGGASTVTPERVIRQLGQATKDTSVKAIVLRVDSPGGTVAASEEIAGLIRDATKPVVASIGDAGASGAYMVSSQADVIYAMPGSTVGSIGVIAEVPNVETLLKKLGIEFVLITAGKYKGAGSPYQPLTAEERKLLQQSVDEVYNQFIDIVALGRKMDKGEVEKLANGWAWPGTKAKELGLIDKLGGFSEAVDEAASRGGITGEPRIVEYTEYNPTQLLQALLGSAGSKLSLDWLRPALPK